MSEPPTSEESTPPVYECDQCGACCQELIVTVYELDLWREPQLKEHVRIYREPGIDGDIGMLACGSQLPCPFLDAEQNCGIYPTRPNVCVALQAGDDQCQHARQIAGLAPLEPLPVSPPPHPSLSNLYGEIIPMSQPEKSFRIGNISAAVFLNESQDKRPFRSVVLQRRYKDGDDWKYSNSFTLNDLPSVQIVLQMALTHVAGQEAESGD